MKLYNMDLFKVQGDEKDTVYLALLASSQNLNGKGHGVSPSQPHFLALCFVLGAY